MTQNPVQRPSARVIDPLTAAGGLLALVAATALITYLALTIPGKIAAAGGPPEEFRAAATRQAASATSTPPVPTTPQTPSEPASTPVSETPISSEANGGDADSMEDAGSTASGAAATANPYGNWPLSSSVDADYWLSIPAIGVEAPIIGFMPWEREVDGVPVLLLPVPNSYAASWDMRSAEPGLGWNTVLSGHSNLYGGVFGDLDNLAYGDEVAVWSPYGVFSYYISEILYIEENNQPLEVRLQNAQWLRPTGDQRVTLITCWHRSDSTHRLIVIATR